MQELIDLLEKNKIKYNIELYADKYETIHIKGKHFQIWIGKDALDWWSDLQKIPYHWGRSGHTWMEEIIEDIEMIKGVKLKR